MLRPDPNPRRPLPPNDTPSFRTPSGGPERAAPAHLPDPSVPEQDVFAARIPGQPDRPADHFLVARLERRMEIPFSSLGPESADEEHPPEEDGLLLVIADGVGGKEAGGRASRVAVDTIREVLHDRVPWTLGADPKTEDRFGENLAAAFAEAERRLRALGGSDSDLTSTLTVACVLWPRLFVVHAGDSRAYRIRDGRIERLTRDHTVAEEFIEKGILTRREARASRFRHVLWNTVGGGARDVRAEVQRYTLREGDRLVLTSDGLTRALDRHTIRDTVMAAGSAEDAAAALLGHAETRASDEDRTALLAFFAAATEVPCVTKSAPPPLVDRAEREIPIPTRAPARTPTATMSRATRSTIAPDPTRKYADGECAETQRLEKELLG